MLCNSLASNGDQRLGEYLGKGLEPCSPASRHYNHRKPDLLFDPASFSQEADVDYPSGLIENRQGIYHLLPHVAVIVHLFVIQDTYGVIICDPAYGLGNIPSRDDISSHITVRDSGDKVLIPAYEGDGIVPRVYGLHCIYYARFL